MPDPTGPESGQPVIDSFEKAKAFKAWQEGQQTGDMASALSDQLREQREAEAAEQARRDEEAASNPSIIKEFPWAKDETTKPESPDQP